MNLQRASVGWGGKSLTVSDTRKKMKTSLNSSGERQMSDQEKYSSTRVLHRWEPTGLNTSEVKRKNAWPQVMNSHKFISERVPG